MTVLNEPNDLLNELKKQDQNKEIPIQLDQYILGGIQKRSHERKQQKRYKWISGITFSLILTSMVTIIRISPTFADYISGLPGGKLFVEIVHFDKGLTDALEHDYAIPVMKSDEHHNLRFTLEGITIDESRMVLFYTVENLGNIDYASIDSLKMKEELNSYGISFGSPHDDLIKKKIDYGKIDLNFTEDTVIPDELTFQINFDLRETDKAVITKDTEWIVSIPIDKEAFIGLKQEYSINQEVQFANQSILFKEATIYPTRMALRIQFDENNEYRLFTFEDLAVVNEKGERWTTSSNGLTASHISDYERILFLDSSYFHDSEELYLEATQIRALPEIERKVIVDLEKGKIVQAPNGLHLTELKTSQASHSFKFLVDLDERYDDPYHSYGILDRTVWNLEGKKIEEIRSVGSTNPDGTFIEFFFTIPKRNESQIVFQIDDYPTRLIDTLKVQIK